MKKKFILFVFIINLLFNYSVFSEDFLCVGRGESQSSVLWCFEQGKEKNSFLIDDRSYTYCIEYVGNDRYFVGGVKNNKGMVWIVENGSIVLSQALPMAKIIYDIKIAEDRTVWAVGAHEYMGACAWSGTEKGEFSISSVLPKGSVAYTVCEGKDGKIFAGGSLYTYGKVWICKNGEWNHGTILNESRQINSICVSSDGTVYACGQMIRFGDSGGHGTVHQGGVWTFSGEEWNKGEGISSAIDIYCSGADETGHVWLGGVGVEDKSTAWLLNGNSWEPKTIDNCYALYSMTVNDATGALAAVGWNKQHQSRIWIKSDNKEWTQGIEINKCTSVKGVTAFVKTKTSDHLLANIQKN